MVLAVSQDAGSVARGPMEITGGNRKFPVPGEAGMEEAQGMCSDGAGKEVRFGLESPKR